jgi:hypothetical protein
MQIVGRACGFFYALILHRIGHLPNLPPGINAVVYEVGRLIRRSPLFTKKSGPISLEPLKETNY